MQKSLIHDKIWVLKDPTNVHKQQGPNFVALLSETGLLVDPIVASYYSTSLSDTRNNAQTLSLQHPQASWNP